MSVLEGVRVVEIAGIGPGPFCAMLLADLGAEVITIERGDVDVRAARARAFDICARGKRSIVLDLKAPGAVEVALRLVERSDALIEGMRPGVMERIGLGPEVCLAKRASLVYGRMTGWGQSGPLASVAGHDSNYTGTAGALWFASPAGQPPFAPPTLLGDIGGGALYLAIGVLAAVLHSRQTGRGQVVDAAIVDGAAHSLNLYLGALAAGGTFLRGEGLLDGPHWARSYRCSDGRWINVQSLEPHFYRVLLDRLGLADDPSFASQADRSQWPRQCQLMAEVFLSRTSKEWRDLLEGTDACFAPVLDPESAADHPHLVARGVYTRVDGVLQAAPAPRFSATPAKPVGRPPARGAHTLEVLGEAGFTTAEIEAFETRGVFGASGLGHPARPEAESKGGAGG